MNRQKRLTINRRVAEALREYADKPAITIKRGESWTPLTYRQLEQAVRHFSQGLRALGVARGDRVAILSENRPEWLIADLAALAIGSVTVAIYPSLPPAQVAYILADSGAKALIASDSKQLQKANACGGDCPNLSVFITMDDEPGASAQSFEQVLLAGDSAGKKLKPSFEVLRDRIAPEEVACLVYTSGTTGDPKGAMLTQGNLAHATLMAQKHLPFRPACEVLLSFLPLSHIFEKVTSYLSLAIGANTYYAESLFKVQENMVDARPTVMQSVPRLYESIFDRAHDQAAKLPKRRQRILHWALRVGKKRAHRRNAGRFVGPFLAVKHCIADKLVLAKIRQRFGGHMRFFVSGGAPLGVDVANFFAAIGVPVLEGYGLTETSAALCLNPYGRAKVGTVGKPMPGVQIKIASDGEILARGENIMKGYWNRPDSTAEVIDTDGWFHTGDIGEIDKQGYLKITDRKKDIIVLANGKNVAPQPIENALRKASLLSEIVLLGDRSGTISALVVPNFEKLARWAKEQSIIFSDPKELVESAMARRQIKAEIDSLSKDLAEFEKVRKIALLDHPLTIENGELTPTLKVRRKIVRDRYGHLLE